MLAPTWTPSALTGRGLAAWWDARHAPSRTLDAAGRVTAWRDRVANRALTTGGTGPLLQANGWLNFDGKTRALITTTFLNAQANAVSVFTVLVPDLSATTLAAGSPRVVSLVTGTDDMDYQTGRVIALAYEDTVSYRWFSFATTELTGRTSLGDDKPVVMSSLVKSGSSVVRGNGSATQAAGTSTFTINAPLGVRVGRNTITESYLGLLGEVIVCDRALPSIEVLRVERYLAAKWRVPLVGSHPYGTRTNRLKASKVFAPFRTLRPQWDVANTGWSAL